MRRLVLGGLLGLLLGLLLVVTSLTAPAGAVASAVTVTRTSGVPTSTLPLVLQVRVANGKAGQKVRLERRTGRSWTVVDSRALGSSRQVRLSAALRLGPARFRVHVLGKGNRRPAVRAFTVNARPRVNPAVPYLDEVYLVGGRLPTTGVRTAALQRRQGSSWVTVATRTSDAAGGVAFARKDAGPVTYRVVAPRQGTRAAFVGLPVTVVPQERTRLISRTPSGTAGNGGSTAAQISAGGRFVAFESNATDLGPADGNAFSDIYLRDLAAGTTTLVSRGRGAPSNGDSSEPTISADGRYVAFASTASNLVPSDPNGSTQDVFRYDRATGAVKLVSHDNGGGGANGASSQPSISGTGARIAYTSTATDLTAQVDDNGTADVFVWNAPTDNAARLSKPFGGATNGGGGDEPRISADGIWVAFASERDDLVLGSPLAAGRNVFLRHLPASTTTLVTTQPCTAGGSSSPIGVADGGTRVAFSSDCKDVLPGDTNNAEDVFLTTMAGGAVTLVSHAPGGGFTAGGDSSSDAVGAMAPDGSRITFASQASDLVGVDGNGPVPDVFTWVRSSGAVSLVSRRRDSFEGQSANGPSASPTISASGRFVAWISFATNQAAGDTGSSSDVVVRDLR